MSYLFSSIALIFIFTTLSLFYGFCVVLRIVLSKYIFMKLLLIFFYGEFILMLKASFDSENHFLQ